MNRLTSKNIFLFDAIGALLSLSLTGGVLPHLSSELGISKNTLYLLAIFPLAYSLYSFTCYLQATQKKWMLIGILFGNSIYLCVSALVMLSQPGITFWGYALLSSEALVLLLVISIEWWVLKKYFNSSTQNP